MQRRRITPIALGILLLFGAVAVRLVWMQGFHWREHHLEAESIRRATRFQMAPRGRILDRRDVVLAHDVPVHELVFLLKEIEPVRWVARRLARDLGPAHPERGFPYDEEALWSSLEELRDRLRPLLGGDEPIPRHLWLRRLDSRLAKRAARRVRDRPQHYPGIDVVITPEEGRIYVRPGDLFAGEAGVRRMERLLDLRAGDLVARVREAYLQVSDPRIERRRRQWIFTGMEHRLVADLPPRAVVELIYHPERYPGLHVREGRKRVQPHGASLSVLIGKAGPPWQRDLDRWKESGEPVIDRLLRIKDIRSFRAVQGSSHHSQDQVGQSGLERTLEEELRGRPGARIIEVDVHGNQRGEDLARESPRPGRDFRLTLDVELCRRLYRLMEEREAFAGSILVAEPESGEILGWCSYPSFDPARRFRSREEFEAYARSKRGFYRNRPITDPIPPGSTFKPLVALALLEEGLIRREERILCEGVYDPRTPDILRCRNHPLPMELDLEEALARSCNVYFYRAGGDRLGLEGLLEWGRAFGFWQRTGLGLAGERAGDLPTASPQSVAIGHAHRVTPVQLLRLACGLARRSSLPALRIFAEENGKMNARDGADDRAVNPAIAPRHWDLVVRGMRGAVERGTAHRQEIGLTRFDCAVKTGTATVGPSDRNENIACLIGFAPFEEPRVAFVVILERVAGHGGEECGPVAAALLDWLAGERDLPLRRGAGKGAR